MVVSKFFHFLRFKLYALRFTTRSGFTIIELLLFAVIFVGASIAMTSVFLSILQVQSKQSATVEVSRESQFVLQTLQRYIESASVIDAPVDVASTTLRLRMSTASQDPTVISQQGSTIYVQEGGSPAFAITSDKVVVSSFSLTKRENSGGHDSVNIVITVSANTENVTKQFTNSLQTTVMRVSAATFDSNLIPSSTAAYDVGVTGQIWRSINNLLYFSDGNVGVNTASPQDQLDVNGRLRVGSSDVYVYSAGSGMILKSSGGTCARVAITDSGAVTSTIITCP